MSQEDSSDDWHFGEVSTIVFLLPNGNTVRIILPHSFPAWCMRKLLANPNDEVALERWDFYVRTHLESIEEEQLNQIIRILRNNELYLIETTIRKSVPLTEDQQAISQSLIGDPTDRDRFTELVSEMKHASETQAQADIEEMIEILKKSQQEAEETGSNAGDDAQLTNTDLQNVLQKQQQSLQTMSNVSKLMHDTAMSVIRKM